MSDESEKTNHVPRAKDSSARRGSPDSAASAQRGSPDPAAPDELPDDPRLLAAVEEFLRLLEQGSPPNRQEFLSRYPELAGPLGQCLDGLELVHKATSRPVPLASGPQSRQTAAADLAQGLPLGDFQILHEIGRGGMGIVYEALQLSLGRRVALKVLPFAATFDARHLQRFQNEAKAAAQLHHTNIVPVFAVDCQRGIHFYAMQLIEGQSLAAIIIQLRREAGRPDHEDESVGSRLPVTVDARSSRAAVELEPWSPAAPPAKEPAEETHPKAGLALSTQRSRQPAQFYRAVARYMVQAAQALEHAHQFGIVHRDIKPANLLIDELGQLWVTDFGLAQFHTDAGLTRTGDLLGTLRYMSPEQATGKHVLLDQRTDIYSLGATLYELVTLDPIFPGRNRQELLHQIINDEPRSPRSREASVPVELETIILKAVSKSAADRYGSAQELAADLERYLQDKPILAKRPSLMERARKWSRRHPSVVAMTILLLLLLTAGLLVNTSMIEREQDKTREALQKEKDRATEARRVVDLLVEISDQELADQPHMENLRKRLLETALAYYKDFLLTHGDDSDAQVELQAGKKLASKLLDELSTLEGGNLLFLAADIAVQKDLKVSEANGKELVDFNKRLSEQRMQSFMSQGTRRQKQYEDAKAQEAELTKILEPSQLKRLRQIELQLQGPRAFHDSYAVLDLKLTADQKRQINTIKEQTWQQMRLGFGGPGGPKKKNKDNQDMEQLMKAEVERILAILTPEQMTRWRELTGAKFEGTWRPPFFRGPGGPPDGGPPFGGDHKKGNRPKKDDV